jgi:hypothetical protein
MWSTWRTIMALIPRFTKGQQKDLESHHWTPQRLPGGWRTPDGMLADSLPPQCRPGYHGDRKSSGPALRLREIDGVQRLTLLRGTS